MRGWGGSNWGERLWRFFVGVSVVDADLRNPPKGTLMVGFYECNIRKV